METKASAATSSGWWARLCLWVALALACVPMISGLIFMYYGAVDYGSDMTHYSLLWMMMSAYVLSPVVILLGVPALILQGRRFLATPDTMSTADVLSTAGGAVVVAAAVWVIVEWLPFMFGL